MNSRKIRLFGSLLAWALLTIACFAGTASASMKPDYNDPDYYRYLARESQKTPKVAAPRFSDGVANKYTGLIYEHSDVYKNHKIIYGIDVSKWQGQIDWKKVKADGIDFAIIRIGYSTLADGSSVKDPYCDYNIKEAKAAGLKVGVYYYAQSINREEVKREAQYVLDNLKGEKLDFPVVFDSEKPQGGRLRDANIDMDTYTGFAEYFCQLIRAGGYTPMVYSSFNGLHNNYDGARLEKKEKIWLARYNTATYYEGKYDIWQYSSSGVVNGISARTDMNFYYAPSGDDSYEEEETGLGQVERVKVKRKSASSMEISFTSVKGAARYEVWKATAYDGIYKKIADQATRIYLDTGLNTGQEYYYKVRAVADKEGELEAGNFSDIVYNYTKFAGKVQVTLKQSANLRSMAGTNHTVRKLLPAGTVCTVRALTRNSENVIWYRVDATYNSTLYTGYVSSKVSTLVMKPVSGIQAARSTAKTITLAWTPQEAVTGYQVYVSASWDGVYHKAGVISGGVSRFRHINRKEYCQYYYKIRAFSRSNGEYTFGAFSQPAVLSTKPMKLNVRTKITTDLRENPGASGRVLQKVPAGEVMTADTRAKDKTGKWWYHVTYGGDEQNIEGYILAKYVRKNQ